MVFLATLALAAGAPTPRLGAPMPRLGVSFAPGGLLFPYYAGAAFALQDAGLITPSTPVGGSSAGCIVAAAIACEVPEATVLDGLSTLVADLRAGVGLRVAVRQQLLALLPDDAVARAAGRLTVCYQRVLPWPKPMLVTEWSSKEDLIDTICASCNWPFFFSRWPLVWVRNSLATDGFFSLPRARFGCPPLPAKRTLNVVCLPSVSSQFTDAELIQPGRGPVPPIPVEQSRWFGWALQAAADDELARTYRLGKEHAAAWVETHGVAILEEEEGGERAGAESGESLTRY
jgi:hypothetical protein